VGLPNIMAVLLQNLSNHLIFKCCVGSGADTHTEDLKDEYIAYI